MSSFIYPVLLHAGSAVGQVGAPYVKTLRLVQDKKPLAAVLTDSEGNTTIPGLYINDSVRWRPCIPIEDMSQAIINGDAIEVFYNLDMDKVVPLSAIVYRNGVIFENTGVLPMSKAVYAIRVLRQAGSGTVRSVNNVAPDADGNVNLTPQDIGAAPDQPTLDEGTF